MSDEAFVAYLDNNANTQVHQTVWREMSQLVSETCGNASSSHAAGKSMKEYLSWSRETIGKLLGVAASDIVFTSGATEGNNLVLRSLAEAWRDEVDAAEEEKGQHVNAPSFQTVDEIYRWVRERRTSRLPVYITSNVEHPSVASTCERLQRDGLVRWETVNVDEHGKLSAEHLVEVLRKHAHNPYLLVSLIWAHNETGVVQDMATLTRLVRQEAKHAQIHCDGTQLIGKQPLHTILASHASLSDYDIDFATASSHKFHGPPGVGFLYVRSCADALSKCSILTGGKQETQIRAGTENIIGIYGMALAMQHNLNPDTLQDLVDMRELRDWIQNQLSSAFGARIRVVSQPDGLWNTLHVCIRNAANLIDKLNRTDVCVNVGSACSKYAMSPVLSAMGVPDTFAQGALRISLSVYTTAHDAKLCVQRIIDAAK